MSRSGNANLSEMVFVLVKGAETLIFTGDFAMPETSRQKLWGRSSRPRRCLFPTAGS